MRADRIRKQSNAAVLKKGTTLFVFVALLANACLSLAQTAGPMNNAIAHLADNQNELSENFHLAKGSTQTVGEIIVQTDRSEAPADGQSAVKFSVILKDTNGYPIKDTQILSIATTGGWLLFEKHDQSTNTPEDRPTDRVIRLRQLKIEGGKVTFKLIAATQPQTATVRIISGKASSNTLIHFVPEHRELIAVGLFEGIVSQRHTSGNALGQTRMNDGFEQEIDHWSRALGRSNRGAARTSFFAKGNITDQTLLTMSYDSDKAISSRLMRDVNPERFYPIYGDNSKKGMDAQSSDRLYVRFDHDKSYLLYGDFATGDGFSQMTGGGQVAGLKQRDFGQYSRTATGLRAHYDENGVLANSFIIYDSLKQAIEEFPANGTSGPFAVRNASGIQNSEKVEIIVRDKNQLGLVKSVTPLIRYVDYTFEPFSGRILLTVPVPTLSPAGDPQSIRITYEVDQGGENFWVVGADGQVQVNQTVNVGGSWVNDDNPLSPYRLQSANINVKLDKHTGLVAEIAHSDSAQYQVNGVTYLTPSGQAGEMRADLSGNAQRIELAHADAVLNAKVYSARSDIGFINSAASISQGKGEDGVKIAVKLSDNRSVFVDAIRSTDKNSGTTRDAGQAGVTFKLSDQLTWSAGFTYTKEDATFPPTALIAGNTALLGSGLTNTGGFLGGSQTNVPIASTLNTTTNNLSQPLEATTFKTSSQYKVNDQFSVNGELEKGINGDKQQRLVLGSAYQLTDKARLYNRIETQTGLASAYSILPADKSTSLTAGISSTYTPGANVFTEYRLQNSSSDTGSNARDIALATGERHTWNLAQGIIAQTSAEYLKILNGNVPSALALSAGIEYSVNPLWRASAKLEFRRMFDTPASPAQQAQNQWLSTISFARKLANDWTLITRNYLLLTETESTSGLPAGHGLQNRAQIGFAWRPTETNKYNLLARYEYKTVRQQTTPGGDDYYSHILSVHGDYHPSRPWWATVRLAAKETTDMTLPINSQRYSAWLVGGRITRDINNKFDVGLLAATLNSPQGGSQQYAYGIEIGRLITKNVWASVGYNVSGFSDRDLTGSDYMTKGVYIRLRFKFDESAFK